MTHKSNEEIVNEFDRLFPNMSALLKSYKRTRSSNPNVADNKAIFFHKWLRTTLTLKDKQCEEKVREAVEEKIESVAKAIYDQMSYYEDGVKPEWVANGNSLKQDEARRIARKALTITNKE